MVKLTPEIANAAIAGFENQIAQLRQFIDGGPAMAPEVTVAERKLLKSQTAAPVTPIAKPKRRQMSAAARKRIGDATRKRWAALRGAKAKTMGAAG